MIANTLWNEFFLDQNVRFPKLPRLLDGISIYDAPYGLGIQFRGGPKKLVINGKSSSELFNVLRGKLNGEKSLDSIFEEISVDHDVNEAATILKLLHAHNLLTDASAAALPQSADVPSTQLAYFERIAGRTAFNANGSDIARLLVNAKVLLIASEGLIPSFLLNLGIAGFRNVGLLHCPTAGAETDFGAYYPHTLMTHTSFAGMNDSETLNLLHTKADDYQYVIVGLENPSRSFLTMINDFCIARNMPVVFLALNANNFEIGPYVVPKGSSCYTCSVLRMNSYNQDALFENIYHDGLTENKYPIDKEIKGMDPVASNIATGLLVSDFARIVSGYSLPSLVNNITEYDILSGSIVTYPVMRVPGCLSCSN
jgi:hypothetical protein